MITSSLFVTNAGTTVVIKFDFFKFSMANKLKALLDSNCNLKTFSMILNVLAIIGLSRAPVFICCDNDRLLSRM